MVVGFDERSPESKPPVLGVHDDNLMMSRPREQAAQPTFVPGRVPAGAASDVFGHYAEPVRTHSEFPPIKLQQPPRPAEPSGELMTPALRKHDYSADRCDPNRPESRRRESDLMPDTGPPMSEFTPRPPVIKPGPGLCDVNTSCMPHQPSLSETLRHGAGKLWSGIGRLFGSQDEETEPPRAIGDGRG